MAVLQSTNVQGSLCVNGVAVGGGKDFKYCCVTASTTWTPSQDLVDGNGVIDAVLVGGGGGGGGASICWCSYHIGGKSQKGNGGGGGTAHQESFFIDSTDACTVTVGAGGSGSVVNFNNLSTNPEIGGCTQFGGVTVGGGGGGTSFRLCCAGNYTNSVTSIGNSIYNGAQNCVGFYGGGMVPSEQTAVSRASGVYMGANWNCSGTCNTSGIRNYTACNCTCKQAATDPDNTYWCASCPVCLLDGYESTAQATCAVDKLTNTCGVPYGIGGERYAGSMWSPDVRPGFITGSVNSFGLSYTGLGDNPCDLGKAGTGSLQLFNEKYKGFGAPGMQLGIGMSVYRQGCVGCICADGAAGNDGVVVLKWLE